ncbi:hypothetical protein [Streptomyces sp. NPDC126514]|uniref:hypothetical protein n=1 Tax=Streptomyces sp. NPDC126514 TaxID=3155210 RepID=UPI00332F7F1A
MQEIASIQLTPVFTRTDPGNYTHSFNWICDHGMNGYIIQKTSIGEDEYWEAWQVQNGDVYGCDGYPSVGIHCTWQSNESEPLSIVGEVYWTSNPHFRPETQGFSNNAGVWYSATIPSQEYLGYKVFWHSFPNGGSAAPEDAALSDIPAGLATDLTEVLSALSHMRKNDVDRITRHLYGALEAVKVDNRRIMEGIFKNPVDYTPIMKHTSEQIAHIARVFSDLAKSSAYRKSLSFPPSTKRLREIYLFLNDPGKFPALRNNHEPFRKAIIYLKNFILHTESYSASDGDTYDFSPLKVAATNFYANSIIKPDVNWREEFLEYSAVQNIFVEVYEIMTHILRVAPAPTYKAGPL